MWSEVYNGTANLFDQTSSLYVDELANIYTSGAVSVSQSQFGYATLKYSQPEKNGLSLDQRLKWLAQSFEDVSKNDTVKHILNDHARRSVDGYFHIFFLQLFDAGLDSGINIKAEMNAKLEDLYPSLPQGKDHVAKLLGGHHYRNILLNPHIIMPDFRQVDSVNHEMDDPLITYAHTKDDYPIDCINCEDDELDRGPPDDYVPVVSMVDLPLASLLKRSGPIAWITIYNCTAQSNGSPESDCDVCEQNPVETLPDVVGSGPGDHEIEITIETNGTDGNDACLFISDINENDDLDEVNAYATISKILGFNYYERTYSASPRKIKKVDHPILDTEFDGVQDKAGDILTICNATSSYNPFNEEELRFNLAMGGLYKLSRPVENQQPIYFAFPYGAEFWYTGGPDMGINFSTTEENGSGGGPICPESGKRTIGQSYEAYDCVFCDVGPVTHGIPDNRYLVSTDYATIFNYWISNAIDIYLVNQSNPQHFENPIDAFEAVNSPVPCDPEDLSGSGTITPLCSLELEYNSVTEEEWYEIEKDFFNGQSMSKDDHIIIHVRAKFQNGESIDKCWHGYFVNPSDANYLVDRAVVTIRGAIEDYSTDSVSYW